MGRHRAVPWMLAGILLLPACTTPTEDAPSPSRPAASPSANPPLAENAWKDQLASPDPGAASPGNGIAPEDGENQGVMPLAEWNRRWTALLRKTVQTREGRVDYAQLHKDPEELNELIAALAPPRSFEEKPQRLAFLLNAFNAMAIRRVLDAWPISSVRRMDDFFERERFELLGRSVSLTDVRDRLIRPMDEPSVHMAMTGAALGYPPLRNEAYRPAELDDQLDDQARRFLASRAHNTVLGNRALLSSLFQWFAEDFETEPYGGPLGFVRHHAAEDSPLGRLLRRNDDPPVTYLDFNWAINSQ